MKRHQAGGQSHKTRSGIRSQTICSSEVRFGFFHKTSPEFSYLIRNIAERVHLLTHILRLVVKPNAKQNNDIQKLELNVKKLEKTAYEVLSSFFMGNENAAKKRSHLVEIFKVATQEERRYNNGEIDGSAEVYVMTEAEVLQSYTSNNGHGHFSTEGDIGDMQRPMANNKQPNSVVQISTTDPIFAQPLHTSHDSFVGEVLAPIDSSNPAMLLDDISPQSRHLC
ncbi:Ydr124wp-like protein, partial [Metarhizium majus ARSEF 297]